MNWTIITQERISYVTLSGVSQWSMLTFVLMFAWLSIAGLRAPKEKSHFKSSRAPKQQAGRGFELFPGRRHKVKSLFLGFLGGCCSCL